MIRRFDLPFYTDVTLLELTNARWAGSDTRLCFLDRVGSLEWLDGTSPPIHAINAEADLRITETNVIQYLAFFCFFVRGEQGPFLIFDSLDNRFLPEGTDRSMLESVFRKPSVIGQDYNGDWRVSALVHYADAVFFASFVVYLSGMIEMMEDWPVKAELGHTVEAPLSVTDVLDS